MLEKPRKNLNYWKKLPMNYIYKFMENVKIQFTDRSNLITKLEKLQFDDKLTFDLVINSFALLMNLKKSELSIIQSIKSNKSLELFDHQIFAAMKVKNEFGGSAILADEVGLGKTVEAGIILKEFLITGLIKSALILVPPSLVNQWQDELQSKFEIFFTQKDDTDYIDASSHELLIFSHSSAISSNQKELLQKRNWDLIIVDEAHSMKNPQTKKYQLLNLLSRKFTLFLTATPIQNNLSELYALVDLLKPGLLGTLSEFKRKYVEDSKMRKINPYTKDELQEILSKVIIRTTREQVKKYVKFTDRIPLTKILKPTNDEKLLYEKITKKIQDYYDSGYDILYLMITQKLISSSTESTKRAIERLRKSKMIDDREFYDLYEIANKIGLDTKASHLLDIIKENSNSKFLIFTEYYATQDYLFKILVGAGYSVTLFNGTMSLPERTESIQKFREHIQIMISTSAGGEGQNFQFCSNVVNYDLPWNPMKVEQRIGRVHRIGQKNNVKIFNLAYEDTIDAYILQLLYTKIKLFTMTLGNLDLLFEDITDDKSGISLFKNYISSRNNEEAKNKFSAISEDWKNRKQHLSDAVNNFNVEVFSNFTLSSSGANNVNY